MKSASNISLEPGHGHQNHVFMRRRDAGSGFSCRPLGTLRGLRFDGRGEAFRLSPAPGRGSASPRVIGRLSAFHATGDSTVFEVDDETSPPTAFRGFSVATDGTRSSKQGLGSADRLEPFNSGFLGGLCLKEVHPRRTRPNWTRANNRREHD